jgi:putative ABC transport system permease protein
MWTNYFTIAMRNLLKRKGFTLLNIFGLTLGITCCLLLFQYVSYEKGYDEFLGNDKPLIRLNMKSFEQGKSKHETASTFPFVAPALASNFPEIEQYCRLLAMDAEPEVEERGTALKNVPGTYFSDSSAIGMFGLEIIHGSRLSMNLPMHMLISEAMAKNLFGKNDPVGKTIAFKSEWDKCLMTVDGIFKNFPEHSHLPIEGLASISSINQIGIKNNGDTNALATMKDWDIFNTYLQIKQGTDQKKFNEKIKRYTANINSESFLRKANRKVDLVPIPVKNIHLDSNADYELKINGDSKRVSYMFLISIFILLIAWVNYINLATTQAVERAKEVGIRKTAGARRISLVFQFMTENILLHLFALSAGIIIAVLLTSYFNHLTGLGSGKEFYISPRYWILFSIIFISGLLLSGAYPAWILSGYKPIQVLKGQFKNSSKGLVLRKSLIIMQFAVSNFLVAGTLIVYMQVKFMHSQPLGFNMDQVLIIEGPRSVINDDFIKLKQPFENELLQVPGVKAYTVSTFPMGSEMIWSNQVSVEGSEDAKTIFHNAVDFNFIPTYGIAMKAGRNYSKSFGLEQDKVIINETACREFGFKSPQDAIGKVLNHPF